MYTLDKSNQLVSERLRASSVADAWSSSKTYAKNDFASKDGFLYRSKADGNVGHQPADEANWWEKASVIGTNGFSPLDSLAISAYNWKQNVYYGRGEFVFKDGLPYVCIQDGTNGAWDPSKWSTKYLTASGCVVSGELIAGEGVSVSGNGSVSISSGYDIRWKGDGRSIVFDSNGASATLVVDGTKVLTEGTAFPSNVTTYSPSAFSAGTWTWYDGSLGSGTGLYVSKTLKASAAAFSPSDWNKIDTVSSMFSSSNTALIRNVRGKTSESDVKLAKIAGVDVYAPSMARAVVVEASVYGSSEIVTGETVTLYELIGDATPVIGSKPYDGVPVTFELTGRGLKTYIIDMTNNKLRPSFTPIFFETSSVKYVSAVYGGLATFSALAAALATFPSTTAANEALVGTVISDTWTGENGTVYSDPMICTAVKDYVGEDNLPHRGAKLERKYASLHNMAFCTNFSGTSDSSRNSYKDSTIRQYLNSDATSGAWHVKKHGSTQSDPTNYGSIRGYRLGCSSELLANTHSVAVSTQSCSNDGGGVYTTYDTFFLDSVDEKYGVRSGTLPEGMYDKYWKDVTELNSPSNAYNNGRIVYRIDDHTTATSILLRSCSYGGTYPTMFVHTAGGIDFILNEARFTPCCVIW